MRPVSTDAYRFVNSLHCMLNLRNLQHKVYEIGKHVVLLVVVHLQLKQVVMLV